MLHYFKHQQETEMRAMHASFTGVTLFFSQDHVIYFVEHIQVIWFEMYNVNNHYLKPVRSFEVNALELIIFFSNCIHLS